MNNIPKNLEEMIQKMAQENRVNRNWLEMVARENGIDFDDHYDVLDPEEEEELPEF